MIRTGTNNFTYYYEGNERVFPCRCGETHRGEYAHWDWVHHECLHSGRLWALEEIEGIKQFLCADCGALFEQVD